jgi:hypothetical protein
MANEFDWEMHRHDNKNLIVTVKDSSDNIVDLTGATEVTFAAAKKTSTGFSSTTAITKRLSVGITEVELTDALNGVLVVKLGISDTTNLKGEYYYEVEVIDSASDVGTVLTGTLTILKDLVTN